MRPESEEQSPGGATGWGWILASGCLITTLLWAGGGLPGWESSVLLHALAVAGLAGAGISLLGRSGFAASGTRRQGIGAVGRLNAGASAALLLLLGVLLASSALAAHPAPAFRRLFIWLCLGAWAYLLARGAGATKRLRALTRALAALGGAGCVVILLDSVGRGWVPPRQPLDNSNHNGALAAAAVPLLFAVSAVEGRGWRRVAWGVLSLTGVVAVVFSRSTAAMAAAVAGLLVLGAAWAAARFNGRGDRAAAGVAALLALVALLAPVVAGRGTLAERSGMGGLARIMGPGGDRDAKAKPRLHWLRLKLFLEGRPDVAVAARLRYARATLGALGEQPLLGFGPGSVPLTFARHRLQVPGAAPWGEAIGQLHSVGLQRLYEGGMAGLALFVAWVLLSLLGSSPPDPLRERLRMGLAGATGALAVAGAADGLETAPALAALGVALLAALASRPEARTAERLPRGLLFGAGAGALVVALIATAGLVRADLAQKRAEEAALEIRSRGFSSGTLEALRGAMRLDGSVGLYEEQAAYATEELALDSQQAGDSEKAAALFEEAERLYRRAAERFPDLPGFASQAGNFLLDRDRPREAVPYLLKGAALDYYDPLGQFYLGEAYRLSGRTAEAVEAHARAIRFYPRLISSAMWRSADQGELRRAVLQRARGMVLEESARPAPGTPLAHLLVLLEREIDSDPAPAPPSAPRSILVHRFDAPSGGSRALHLFGRTGFTIENLPVAILDEGSDRDETPWARILEGLPVVTAAGLEAAAGGSGSDEGTGAGERPARQRAGAVMPATRRGDQG